ncbi:polysaccharide export protein EpsE [Methyloversatilis sp. MC4-4]|uniref:polysaccharide export protein EpsE n=1 Tax=Methyloversatilis sp. MC4-4 TaxID=3132824 RepID=UPI003CE97156
MTKFVRLLLGLCFGMLLLPAAGAADAREYVLGSGDIIRVTVFQNPDLTVETRVTENGSITYPLIGGVAVGGLTLPATEKLIADKLRDGGFVLKPQVNVLLLQIRGNQVSVLGMVNRPGRYPIEIANTRVTDMLATAGGASVSGADIVTLVGTRNDKPFRAEIDIPALFQPEGINADIPVMGGDILYIHRAPVFYIYGEVNRPGSYRLERGMTVMQALAQGGGITLRGTDKRLKLHRRNAAGAVEAIEPDMSMTLQSDDVVYVRESLF